MNVVENVASEKDENQDPWHKVPFSPRCGGSPLHDSDGGVSGHTPSSRERPKKSPLIITVQKKETLLKYIERFTREVFEVCGVNDKLKCFIFKNGLRSYCIY